MKIIYEVQVTKQIENLADIITQSYQKPIFIYKHSSICPGSARAKESVDSFLQTYQNVDVFQITVQTDRALSNEVAKEFQIKHESPQLLFLKNGKVERVLNHYQISFSTIEKIQKEYLD